jgi:hypothetical protein
VNISTLHADRLIDMHGSILRGFSLFLPFALWASLLSGANVR